LNIPAHSNINISQFLLTGCTASLAYWCIVAQCADTQDVPITSNTNCLSSSGAAYSVWVSSDIVQLWQYICCRAGSSELETTKLQER